MKKCDISFMLSTVYVLSKKKQPAFVSQGAEKIYKRYFLR